MTQDRVRAWRHRLHELAETAGAEHRTAAFVADTLTSLGIEVVTGLGGTGVVGTLRRGVSRRAIGLRAELDALPLTEHTGLAFASQHEGRMHACGHDGHMAMVLGAAAALAAAPSFDGSVHFVFQPAEEPGWGARAMIDDGLFERFPMDALVGLHNLPGLPAAALATRGGPIMAGEDNFRIEVTGRGGHASAPHTIIDPLVVAAQIIVALQSIVARTIDPLAAAVVSCTTVHTDGARNAIPTTVEIAGDTRHFSADVSETLEARIRAIAAGIAHAHGAMVTVDYTREFAVTANDPGLTELATRAAAACAPGNSDGETAPIMASEDFGVYGAHVPINFSFIGNGRAGELGATPLHSHDYLVNDAILPVGVAYYREVVRRFMAA